MKVFQKESSFSRGVQLFFFVVILVGGFPLM